MGILCSNHKLPVFHSESLPSSRAKASTNNYTEKSFRLNNEIPFICHLHYKLRKDIKRILYTSTLDLS